AGQLPCKGLIKGDLSGTFPKDRNPKYKEAALQIVRSSLFAF
ncbi:hypothetical protein HMPREF1988_02068, partial [Porphyromonas gingivalis F0185]